MPPPGSQIGTSHARPTSVDIISRSTSAVFSTALPSDVGGRARTGSREMTTSSNIEDSITARRSQSGLLVVVWGGDGGRVPNDISEGLYSSVSPVIHRVSPAGQGLGCRDLLQHATVWVSGVEAFTTYDSTMSLSCLLLSLRFATASTMLTALIHIYFDSLLWSNRTRTLLKSIIVCVKFGTTALPLAPDQRLELLVSEIDPLYSSPLCR
jgi:hypothetical protein